LTALRSPVVLQRNDFTFPSPDAAMKQPNGLLAIGGDLSPSRLLAAYHHGIFPWFNRDDEPILWWSPDPRAVMQPSTVKVSRSLRRRLARNDFTITMDRNFESVVAGCAGPRQGATGTWITPSMQAAYTELHKLGYAHSVETWLDNQLVGGLYGVALGKMFYGESMFSRVSDASKVAMVTLAHQLLRWGFTTIDCQVLNPHMASLGATEIPRSEFLQLVRENRQHETDRGPWQFDAH
jgi:leucyl/phenylalanyl-tRNA---protein transferase